MVKQVKARTFGIMYISGFTLMETLVAMMVLVICMTVIMQLFSGALKAGKLTEDHLQAVYYAREKIEEVLLADQLAEEVVEGVFDETYRFQVLIDYLEPEEDAPKPPVDLFSITVIITWFDGLKEKHFEINSLKIAELSDAVHDS